MKNRRGVIAIHLPEYQLNSALLNELAEYSLARWKSKGLSGPVRLLLEVPGAQRGTKELALVLWQTFLMGKLRTCLKTSASPVLTVTWASCQSHSLLNDILLLIGEID